MGSSSNVLVVGMGVEPCLGVPVVGIELDLEDFPPKKQAGGKLDNST